MLKEDRTLLTVLHLSQLLDFVTGVGGFLVPLFIWIAKRDEIYQLNEQGKEVINFQITMFLLSIIAVPLILALGLGILILILIPIVIGIFSIVNALKANRGEAVSYPFTIRFIK